MPRLTPNASCDGPIVATGGIKKGEVMSQKRQLTDKQEKFAQCVANGMSLADAYRNSYNVSPTAKNSTIQRKAAEVNKVGNVSARIDELRLEVAEKSAWTRQNSVEALKLAFTMAKDQGDTKAITGAIKELNVMHGYNAPIKQEITGSGGGALTVVINGIDSKD